MVGVYNSVIDRTDAGALIPEDASHSIIQNVVEESAALSLFRKATMSRKQQRMPVLASFPQAYFVTGDTGLKQTTDMSWANKYLNAEELACIIPIPQLVLDDADFDIWGEVQPRAVEAIGRTIDNAVFFGVNAPAAWPQAVIPAAVAAGNVQVEAALAAAGGFFGDIDGLLDKVEADGFDVDGYVADRSVKGKFRAARNSLGNQLDANRVGGDWGSYDGDPVKYAMRGLWGTAVSSPRLIAGDWSQFVGAVRSDINWKVLDQAVLTDDTGLVIVNLPQQDMVALRLTFRFAWQVANPLTREQATEANRYPAGVLKRPAT